MSDINIPDDLRGIEEADAELQRLMAEDQQTSSALDAAGKPAAGEDTTEESANTNDGTRAAETDDAELEEKEAGSNQTASGLNAAGKANEPKPDPKSQADAAKKAAEAKAANAVKEESRLAKDRGRRVKTWDELNAEKASVAKEREALQREKAEFQAQADAAEEQFSPEAFDDAAQKFEDAGKLELAEMSRAKAAALRKNPSQNQGFKARREAAAKATEAQRKEWTLKAGQDFPDLPKQNSPLQLKVGQLLGENPELKEHPKGIYLASRLADLELKAAGSEAKDTELAQLRAKVKELEQATAPGEGGNPAHLPGPKTFSEMSDTEQLSDLERMANDVGMLR